MHDFVDVVRSHTRFHLSGSNVQYFAAQLADLAHSILLRLVEDRDLITSDERLLGVRNTVLGVVGVSNALWYSPAL